MNGNSFCSARPDILTEIGIDGGDVDALAAENVVCGGGVPALGRLGEAETKGEETS